MASGSTLLLDDCWERGDDAFLGHLMDCASSPKLAALGEKWARDPRAWARKMQLAYLERLLNRPGHHPLAKKLFKAAEKAGDAELMGAWMVAFDRIMRRRISS